MIQTFSDLLDRARACQGACVGVPSAEDAFTIRTVLLARKEGLAEFILCGNVDRMKEIMREEGGCPDDFTWVEAADDADAASRVVAMAREGRVTVILKGFLPTATLLKPCLDKETGLRTGRLLSDILLVEQPVGEKGLLGMTDGGVAISPDFDQKCQIIENAVSVFHALGYEEPRVGVMAAKETVSEKMPATVDAQRLTEHNRNGGLPGCRVYGPLALDIAVSREAAEHKGITDPVAGHVDIMVMPNIESGNILGKAFTYFLRKPVAHVVIGARIPILIPSRNESEVDKLHSVALGVLSSGSQG